MDQDAKNKLRAEIDAELQALSDERLCERLRGLYRVPINDGCGPIDGSMEFVRQFETGPIQHEAARRIEQMRKTIESSADIIVEQDDE